MSEDFADRHVARWRDHWIDVPFDDAIEAAVVRIGRLCRYLRESKHAALLELGLQDFEYDTLHTLMIRDTPGRASPRDLAQDLGVSPAGMTGRLDGLEKAGYVRRIPSSTDRRRVDVEVTRAGATVWRKTMARRGRAEDDLMATLSAQELTTLNQLLKRLTLHTEKR
jgi:DNA-binding MarR family transcriptional regulator